VATDASREAVRILRAAQQKATPWKNGAGLTRELAVHPTDGDLGGFGWRASIAEIRAAGPFSDFPGIDRRIAVLDGRLSLSIGDHPPIIVTPESPPLAFPGEAAVIADPCGGAATDLNVMTRRGRFVSRLTLCGATEPQELTLESDATLILALTDLEAVCPARAVSLSRLDTLLFEGGSRCAIKPRSGVVTFWLAQISALPMTAAPEDGAPA
jgi:hypothetical protein